MSLDIQEPRQHRKRYAFNPEEDCHLRELVSKYGEDAWDKIASRMPRRDRRQCRERWINYLSPAVANGPWSVEEEELLKEKVQTVGRSWKAIQIWFPGRTDINIKNHWKQMEKLGHEIPKKSRASADIFQQLLASWMIEVPLPMAEDRGEHDSTTLF
jgi:hypothetical protein